MGVLAIFTPFLLIPLAHLYRTIFKNKDDVSTLNTKMEVLATTVEASTNLSNKVISHLEQSIEAQQAMTKELHTLVTTLDKKVSIIESHKQPESH